MTPSGRGGEHAPSQPVKTKLAKDAGSPRTGSVRGRLRTPASAGLQPAGETAVLAAAAAKVAVITFPGSQDDRDAVLALANLGAQVVPVWHASEELPDVGAVVLPGGFSYGDYLRAGALARFSPAMEAVARFAADGGLVLGICNGFQILCEAGLLPGALRRQRLALVRLPGHPAPRRADGHRLHLALLAGAAARHPGQARRGLLVRGRGAPGRARGAMGRSSSATTGTTRTARSPESPA